MYKMRHLGILGLALIVVLFFVGVSYFGDEGREVGITQFAILEDLVFSVEEKYEDLTNVSRELALEELEEGRRIVDEMVERELPFVLMNDTLLAAGRLFEQAEYANILRGDINATAENISEAKEALRLLDWEEIDYDDVVVYINSIRERRDRTFGIYDSLINAKVSLSMDKDLKKTITGNVVLNEGVDELTGEDVFLSGEGMDERTKELFNDASVAFYDDRDEAVDLLMELGDHIEAERIEFVRAGTFKSGLVDFIKENWRFVLFFLLILGVMGIVFYAGFNRRMLSDKINKMELEEKTLLTLMKKVQSDRFKSDKISELIYNIRMKKYEERLTDIKTRLPVLKSKLNGASEGVKKKVNIKMNNDNIVNDIVNQNNNNT